MMFERTVREQTIQDARRALAEEFGEDRELTARAEMLAAIADDYDVSAEELVGWIHYHAPGKEWTTREFVGWASKLHQTKLDLAEHQRAEIGVTLQICPGCWAHVAERIGPSWNCPQCGVYA